MVLTWFVVWIMCRLPSLAVTTIFSPSLWDTIAFPLRKPRPLVRPESRSWMDHFGFGSPKKLAWTKEHDRKKDKSAKAVDVISFRLKDTIVVPGSRSLRFLFNGKREAYAASVFFKLVMDRSASSARIPSEKYFLNCFDLQWQQCNQRKPRNLLPRDGCILCCLVVIE